MKFKKFEIEDAAVLNRYLRMNGELSCETAFVNLYMWQGLYYNSFSLYDDILIVKSIGENGESYSLPFGLNVKRGMELILEHTAGALPVIWAQEGARFDEFLKLYADSYNICESRDDEDYIYLTENLSHLPGKKYHSKRNHISAFSKRFNWKYEQITDENIEKVIKCAELWYAKNDMRSDERLQCEKNAFFDIAANMNKLNVCGGAISIDEKIVAFTLGSPLNDRIFDIHIEKALSEFSGAYSVINREFALRELDKYEYINREDDLGIDGLRRAKLSYHPHIILKKYVCIPEGQV